MNAQTIETLPTFPPPHRPVEWKYKTQREGQAALSELQKRLGLPPGNRSYNLPLLNRKIIELEAIARAVGKATPGTTPSAPLVYATPVKVAPVAAPAPTPKPSNGEMELNVLRKLSSHLFGSAPTHHPRRH